MMSVIIVGVSGSIKIEREVDKAIRRLDLVLFRRQGAEVMMVLGPMVRIIIITVRT